MRFILAAAIILSTYAATHLMSVDAAQNPASARISRTHAELIVFEAENCAYCFIFRRDVAPNYLKSPRARDVPLRYVDVNAVDLDKLKLNGPLTMVPTIVLMRNGREVDRITGYMGPEPFYHMVSQIMR
ncbi:MAG: thioredoxin family protein [Alphaproteobacteria bacterium]|nr:thioredoxin family protein [Alphaproteobacteria bacterium]